MDLTDLERKILGLVKEYLNQNHVFKAKKIVPLILNGLKKVELESQPNERGIQKILWKLIRQRIVVPGSKLLKENILENPTRKSLYNHIDKNPGTHVREIMDTLNLGSRVALWHLNMLIKFGLVRFTKIGRHKAFFNSSLPDDFDKEIFYLGEKTINQIIQLLYTNGEGMVINQIADQINVHYNTVKNNLEKLQNLDLIAVETTDNQTHYYINPETFKNVLAGIEEIKKQV